MLLKVRLIPLLARNLAARGRACYPEYARHCTGDLSGMQCDTGCESSFTIIDFDRQYPVWRPRGQEAFK